MCMLNVQCSCDILLSQFCILFIYFTPSTQLGHWDTGTCTHCVCTGLNSRNLLMKSSKMQVAAYGWSSVWPHCLYTTPSTHPITSFIVVLKYFQQFFDIFSDKISISSYLNEKEVFLQLHFVFSFLSPPCDSPVQWFTCSFHPRVGLMQVRQWPGVTPWSLTSSILIHRESPKSSEVRFYTDRTCPTGELGHQTDCDF